ncbi:hypothetical protein DIPPA_20570 [Diplonema papillatum]|nr:hypothetical protein DIPPA_20570 [Diplonema papillatum]
MSIPLPFARNRDVYNDACSVTSTTGGSVGYTDTDHGSEPCCQAVKELGGVSCKKPINMSAGHGTVLLNGIQLIKCPLPEAGGTIAVTAEAEDVNVSEERGGLGLDILFMASKAAPTHPHKRSEGEWRATLHAVQCADPPREVKVNLGTVKAPGQNAHVGCYLNAQPSHYTVTISHVVANPNAASPQEEQLVNEVRTVLLNPRLNRDGGSLSSVLLNNKAKESVLYDKVVGKNYNNSWLDFVKKHSNAFEVFYYSEALIKEQGLGPHIKKCDARIYLKGKKRDEIYEIDRERCHAQKRSEDEFKKFLVKALGKGEVSQVDLLAKLRDCKGFTESLQPTFSLLMRFLARHSGTFVWMSDPDQPTRIGLASGERFPHHELPDVFLKTGNEALNSSGLDDEEMRKQQQELEAAEQARIQNCLLMLSQGKKRGKPQPQPQQQQDQAVAPKPAPVPLDASSKSSSSSVTSSQRSSRRSSGAASKDSAKQTKNKKNAKNKKDKSKDKDAKNVTPSGSPQQQAAPKADVATFSAKNHFPVVINATRSDPSGFHKAAPQAPRDVYAPQPAAPRGHPQPAAAPAARDAYGYNLYTPVESTRPFCADPAAGYAPVKPPRVGSGYSDSSSDPTITNGLSFSSTSSAPYVPAMPPRMPSETYAAYPYPEPTSQPWPVEAPAVQAKNSWRYDPYSSLGYTPQVMYSASA